MRKIFIWLLAFVGGLVAVIVAAVILIPLFVDVESYKPEIERKVTEATGRPFALGGELKASVFPWVGVSFTDLRLGNGEGFESSDFIRIQSFEARMKLMPLLSKKVEIKKFVIDGAEVFLEKSADGRANWEFAAKEQGPAPETTGQGGGQKPDQSVGSLPELALGAFTVEEFAVVNSRFSYDDKALGRKNEISGITFMLDDISLDHPVAFLFKADIDGKPVAVNGSLGPIGRQIGRGMVNIEVDIDIADHLRVALKGSIEDPLEKQNIDLVLSVAPFSPRSLAAAFGQQLPVMTTDPAALESVALNLHVQGHPAHLVVKESSLIIDESTLQIAAVVKDMAKPDISFTLDLDTIDLDRYLPPPAEKKEGDNAVAAAAGSDGKAPGQGGGQPAGKEPIDYTPLREVVVDGAMTIGKLTAHGARMENIILKITGKEGIFTLDPFRLDLYGGSSSVVGNVNVQADTPVAEVVVRAEKIAVGPLLRDSMEKDIIEGILTASADIRFQGDEVEMIKSSLNGKGDLTFVDGALVGIDLAEMARNVGTGLGVGKSQEKPRTDFAELRVPFTLTNGVLQTADTRLVSPFLRLAASGDANLVTEGLDLKVRPTLVTTLKGQGDTENRQGITVPILIQGTFAEPQYSADLSAVVSSEALEEAVKDPEGTVKKVKALEETGRQLLKGLKGN